MKRTKQMQEFIEMSNTYARENGIKNPSDDMLCLLQHYLLTHKMWKGFMYCKSSTYTDVTGKQEIIYVSCKEEECEFIQIL